MELEPIVKQMFELCREYCKKVTDENTIEKNEEYKSKLEDFEIVWKLHNQRVIELITKSKNKCDNNIILINKWKS